eukprot:Tamp_18840.p1 GENE.Tamp_18840~~Tamp_18840.p1  ORF type:complete len:373 (+),score=61.48 Tamp_18840:86-1120(+)
MALFAVGAVLATLSAAPAAAFMPTALPKCAPPFRGRAAASPTRRLQMTVPKSAEDERALQTAREEAKKALLASCEDFRVAQLKLWAAEAEEEARLKAAGVDVKKEKDRLGGLFGAESLGTVRMEIGEMGNKTVALAEALAALNPNPEPVLGWATSPSPSSDAAAAATTILTDPSAVTSSSSSTPGACILDGRWKKLFTTAADATFKPSERRGNATVEQLVDARRGFFTNVIRFDGTSNKVREFHVTIRGTPASGDTLGLDFRRITLFRRSKVPWLLGKLVILLPPRSIINAIAKWGSRGKAQSAPKAQLQLLYVDHELWVHRSGEGNLFVQRRLTPYDNSPQSP